jgi:hypothetical protein
MKKSRVLLAGLLISALISAFALTKNVDFSAKVFADEPRIMCIQEEFCGGDHTDIVCPKCTGNTENLKKSNYTACTTAPAPIPN